MLGFELAEVGDDRNSDVALLADHEESGGSTL
jgi:hypothetical protein